jgi:hypothetical protein
LFEDSTFNSMNEAKSNYISVDKSVDVKNESHFEINSSFLVIAHLFETSFHNSFV